MLEAGAGQGARQDGLWVNAVEDILVDPPCDVVLVRPDTTPVRSVLVPVRGGPSAELALRLATILNDRNSDRTKGFTATDAEYH